VCGRDRYGRVDAWESRICSSPRLNDLWNLETSHLFWGLEPM
jgi:hypothetical protein